MDDVLTLIGESYAVNSIGVNVPTETRTEVWAHKRSLTRYEWFEASRQGLNPSCVLITNAANYSGEKIAIWGGVRYAIYRTYQKDDTDEIELHLERRQGA